MANKKKVLHFLESGGLYGAESVVLNLSREIITHNKYRPIIGCLVQNESLTNDLHSKSLQIGISAYKIKIRNALLWIDIPKAARFIKSLNISFIHCHNYKAFVFAFMISKLIKIPVISTCHLWFLKGNPPLKMRFMIKMELFLYRFVPIVIAVSEPIKKSLMDAGIKSNRIKVINNGIFVKDYQLINQEHLMALKQEFKIADNDFIVLNVGRLSLQKNQKSIIDAAKLIKKENVRFLIVGEGTLRSELEKYITENNLSHIIRLLGFRDDIKELLSISDVFVLPSFDEGMPISLLEAVASKTPVITTMVGDISKLITHERTGLAIPVDHTEALADAILQLKMDTEKRIRLAKTALDEMYKRYSSDLMYNQYEKIYNETINI